MGYSCSAKAQDTIRMTLLSINGLDINDYSYSNTWKVNGNKYFFERGREQADGSITGAIFKFIGETSCKKIGSIKVMPDGKVKSWPGMPKSKIIDSKPMFQLI